MVKRGRDRVMTISVARDPPWVCSQTTLTSDCLTDAPIMPSNAALSPVRERAGDLAEMLEGNNVGTPM